MFCHFGPIKMYRFTGQIRGRRAGYMIPRHPDNIAYLQRLSERLGLDRGVFTWNRADPFGIGFWLLYSTMLYFPNFLCSNIFLVIKI